MAAEALAEHRTRTRPSRRTRLYHWPFSDRERRDDRITGIACDHSVDTQVGAAFNLILGESSNIDILVNNVWGGYERMVETVIYMDQTFLATAPVAVGRIV